MIRPAWCLGLLAVILLSGCSFKRMGIERMAAAVSATATAYGRDNDPEFVRLGAPATLKMVEMLLDQGPDHRGLLLTACSGFAQYAYAFLQADAELVTQNSPADARAIRRRASMMYERSRAYCLRGLELSLPGIGTSLAGGKAEARKAALARAGRSDVPLLYWAAAAWGGSLAVADNPLMRVGEIGAIRALLERALELDEAWESGALHELMIGVEGLPALVGGSPQRARAHFDRAVLLSEGQSAFAYVTMATSVSDSAEAERLLKAALAVDVEKRPAIRLANLIAQKRARHLLAKPAPPR